MISLIIGLFLINIFANVDFVKCAYFCFALLLFFLLGVSEDITGKIGAKMRFYLTLACVLSVMSFFEERISFTGVAGVDQLLSYPIFAFAVTLLAMSGLVQSYNIIDGLNGLVLGNTIICQFCVCLIALELEDETLFAMSSCTAVAAASVFIFNFPKGKIFLGDGGAYALGAASGITGLVLVYREPIVAPWLPIVLNAYPITETIFTVLRRLCQGSQITKPDNYHLHSLMFKALSERKQVSEESSKQGNYTASLILLASSLIFSSLAMYLHTDNNKLVALYLAFVICYVSARRALRTRLSENQ